MRNIFKKSLFIAFSCLLATSVWGDEIFSFTVTSATTAIGTYDAEGGKAECKKAMATEGSNEVTIGTQTFYKFNSSSEWIFTLDGETLEAGDIITFTCACSENKSGKGLIVNGVTKTNDFKQGEANTIVFEVETGDAFIGESSISVKRNDADIKFGSIVITREGGGSTDKPVESVTISGPTESAIDVPFKLTAKAVGAKATTFWWTTDKDETHISDTKELTITPSKKGTYVYKVYAKNDKNTNPVSATHTIKITVPSGEIIKATTQQVVTGTIGGSVTTNLSKGDAQKLNKSKYFGVTLKTGTFKENDVFIINITTAADLGKCMIYADKEGTDLVYEGASYSSSDKSITGEMKITLPAAVNGKQSLFLYRENGNTQWNPTFSYIAVTRPAPDPVHVTGVELNKKELTLEEGEDETLIATVIPSDADIQDVSWKSSFPEFATVDENGKVTALKAGETKITVSTDDGNKTAECKVTVKEPSKEPLVLSATWKDIVGEAVIDNESDTKTITGKIAYSADLTSIEPKFEGKNLIITDPKGATDFSKGPVKYRFTGEGPVTEYSVTITKADPSNDASLKSLKVVNTPLEDFNAEKFEYNYVWNCNIKMLPTVQAEPNFDKAKVKIDPETGVAVPGTATVTVTAEDGKTTKTYTINFTCKELSHDATLKKLAYDGKDITLTADKFTYDIELPKGTEAVPVVTAEANDENANEPVITPAEKLPGATTIEVTAEDGTTKKTYTINFTVKTIKTTLTLHEPGIYKENYKTDLVKNGEYYYEVYYSGRLDEGGTKLTIHTKPIDKSKGVTKNETNSSCEAVDGWFKVSGTDKGTGFSVKEEFNTATERCHTMKSGNTYELHIAGFDQFSIYAADKKWNEKKPSESKYFKVTIDDELQTMTPSTDPSIRRFNITTGEHLITVEVVGDGNLMGGFSLREAQIPTLKYEEGNDTTQKVRVTEELKQPIIYSQKYGNVSGAKVELKWDGNEATGIELSKNATNDTLTISGKAMCAPGLYKYSIVTTLNGEETGSMQGKFTVISDIRVQKGDTIIDAYVGENMEELILRYYALDGSGISIKWKDDKEPEGLATKDDNSKYTFTISGNITAKAGRYPFTITIDGNSETVIRGYIDVMKQDLGSDPILYLYHTRSPRAYDYDGVYQHLLTKYNLVARTTLEEGQHDFEKFKAIIISEDVSADNQEVLNILNGKTTKLPVLNLKGFTYPRIGKGLGTPDNGTRDTVSHNSGSIFVLQNKHLIFGRFPNLQSGDTIKILDAKSLEKDGINGVMPIAVSMESSFSIATAYTRSTDASLDALEAYYRDGKLQTIIHEIPAKERGTGFGKYICVPISHKGSKYLTSDGKKLMESIMDYLLSSKEADLKAPNLQIKSFSIEDIQADIANNNIILELTQKQLEDLDSLKHVKPVIKLANSDLTFVEPSTADAISLQYSMYVPYEFVVSDYIRRRVYEFSLTLKTSQGLDETSYSIGDWVNIFDIYGHKITTTNENIYTMDLPRGIYIAITESGQTIKILR